MDTENARELLKLLKFFVDVIETETPGSAHLYRAHIAQAKQLIDQLTPSSPRGAADEP